MPEGSSSRQPVVGFILHQAGQQLPGTASIHVEDLESLLGVPACLALSKAAPGGHVPLEGLQLAVEGLQLVVTAAPAMDRVRFQGLGCLVFVGRQ